MSEQIETPTGQSQDPAEQVGTPNPEPSIWDTPYFDRFKSDGKVDHEKLAKTTLELDKMVSQRVPIPGDNATPEEWTKFYDKLRPQQANEYKIELPGIDNLDEGKMANWKKTFHDSGMSQAQVEKVMRNFHQEVIQETQAANEANLKTQTEVQLALKQKWGANYEANKGLVQSMLREMGGDELLGTFNEGLEYDQKAAEFLYDVAKMMQTSSLLKDEGKGNFGLITIAEAEAEKQGIMHDPNNAFYEAYHSANSQERLRAMKKVNELNLVITGGK